MLLPLLTAGADAAARGSLNLTSDVLLFLLAIVAVALVGGVWPALLAAVAGSLLLNYYFIPPLHGSPSPSGTTSFALVGVRRGRADGQRGGRPRRPADQPGRPGHRRGRDALHRWPASVLRGERAAAGAARPGPGDVRHDVGRPCCERAGDACAGPGRSAARPATRWRHRAGGGGDLRHAAVRAAGGGRHRGADRRPGPGAARPGRCRPRTGGCWPRSPPRPRSRCGSERLADAAAEAGPLAEADRTRTALLAAVSHDLRTPLAVGEGRGHRLRSPGVQWTDAERAELLATADESLDRLTRLVNNLLDMSRLQAGALGVHPAPSASTTSCPLSLDELGPAGRAVQRATARTTCPSCTPTRPARADPGQPDRQRPAAQPPPTGRRCSSAQHAAATGSSCGSSTAAPASRRADWERIFLPFQRLGDRDNTTGVGLGPGPVPRAGRGDGRHARARRTPPAAA